VSSIREQIVLQAVALLQAVGGPSGLTIFRERPRPIESNDLPAIFVYFADDEPTPELKIKFQAPITEHHLGLMLELRAAASDDLPADAAIDPLYIWAVKQLVGNERLGGLAMGITEGPMKWFSKEADITYAAAALHLIWHYRTNRLDPTSVT
jgi:hypothetical protein